MARFEFHLLDKSFDRTGFDCGVPALNAFLAHQARQAQTKGFNKTYVACLEGDARKTVRGYYAVSMGQIGLFALPEALRKSLPKNPVPIARIGRLAIDLRYQGQGLGRELLVNALKRVRGASQVIGAYAVAVDAKDATARGFYEKYGFIAFMDDPLSLFLPIASIPA